MVISFLKLPEVKKITALGRSSIYAKMSEGTFPKSIKLGDGTAVAWIDEEIYQWVADRIKESRPDYNLEQNSKASAFEGGV